MQFHGLLASCVGLIMTSMVTAEDEVTCGSAVKIALIQNGYYLHSADAKFHGGSGQRTATFTPDKDHGDSFFLVREANKEPQCLVGTPIQCGRTIRLTHLNSNANLHSHKIRSMLMGQMDQQAQEVTIFGQRGEGDGGDDWMVHCEGDYWRRNQKVKFMHVAVQDANYNDRNCRGCPIVGHLEAFANWPFDENRISFKAENGVHLYN